MSVRTGRFLPVSVRRGDWRVGDVIHPDSQDPKGDGRLGAIIESVKHEGAYVTASWRVLASGRTVTNTSHEDCRAYLMQRVAPASARDELWAVLNIDPKWMTRAQFDRYMDAYDRAAYAGPVRPDEEPTP